MNPVDLKALVQAVGNVYGHPSDLLFAQVMQESSGDEFAFRYEPAFFDHVVKGNPNALAGAYGPLAACSFGLLQVLLETAMEAGFDGRPEQLFVPRVGLTFGAKHLQRLVHWAGGNYHLALAAYNAGQGNTAAGLKYADAVFQKAGRTI